MSLLPHLWVIQLVPPLDSTRLISVYHSNNPTQQCGLMAMNLIRVRTNSHVEQLRSACMIRIASSVDGKPVHYHLHWIPKVRFSTSSLPACSPAFVSHLRQGFPSLPPTGASCSLSLSTKPTTNVFLRGIRRHPLPEFRPRLPEPGLFSLPALDSSNRAAASK